MKEKENLLGSRKHFKATASLTGLQASKHKSANAGTHVTTTLNAIG